MSGLADVAKPVRRAFENIAVVQVWGRRISSDIPLVAEMLEVL
jgi:hypothetical protein